MRPIVYLFLIICLTTCKAQTTKINKECNVNSRFEKEFFYYIDNIEAYTLKRQNSKDEKVGLSLFKLSLQKISNYVEVNYSLLANYEYGYPSQEIFNIEKERWESWYKEHKCENLQWK